MTGLLNLKYDKVYPILELMFVFVNKKIRLAFQQTDFSGEQAIP